jgi:hypothetical protein
MPDLDLIKLVSTLGVGGLLASVIFIYYRVDFLRKRHSHHDTSRGATHTRRFVARGRLERG